MNSSPTLPADIQCLTEGVDETRYVLPRRNLGRFRGLAWIPILMGLAIGGFMIFWTAGFAGGMAQVFGPAGAISALVAFPGFLGAATLLSLGIFILQGHAELVVSRDQILCIERCGLLKWRRRIPTSTIEQIQVQSSFEVTTNGSRQIHHFENLSLLMAKMAGDKTRLLVLGYPRDWVLGLANELAGRLNRELAHIPDPSLRVIDIEEVLPNSLGSADRHEQPASSPIIREEIPGGFSLLVPAPGVWKGSAGLFTFSLFWCGFMTLFTAFVIFFLTSGDIDDKRVFWIFPAFSVAFWAIGIGMMLAAINMGRRQAVIAVTHGELKLMQSSLFGTSRKEWLLSELQTVQLGPSGMSVNDVPVLQLHIREQNGGKYGLLTGRDEAELEWIATLLRQNIPAVQRLMATQTTQREQTLAGLSDDNEDDDADRPEDQASSSSWPT